MVVNKIINTINISLHLLKAPRIENANIDDQSKPSIIKRRIYLHVKFRLLFGYTL